MKRNKLGILAAIALGGLMVCGPIARAQDNNSTPPSATQRPSRARGNSLEAVMKQLDLNDDQKTKVKSIMQDNMEKTKALFQDSSLSRDEKMEKRKTIMEATDAKLKDVLTADQYKKYEELRKQRMQTRVQRRDPNASSAPAANSGNK